MTKTQNLDCERIENYDWNVRGDESVKNIINEITENGTASQEDPFYVFNIGDIFRKHQIWIKQMPRVIPHYAVKCNDNDVVLATLVALGTSFDCASKAEIKKVLSLGVNPERIIFANPEKPKQHILYAASVGVNIMTFDGDIELHKIKLTFPDAKYGLKKVKFCLFLIDFSCFRLVLRIRCEAEGAQCPLGQKFGCDPVTEAPKLLKVARNLNLNVIGISFHVGSGCRDYPIYFKAIGICKKLFDEANALGFNMTLLDIGGGFPGDNDKTIDGVATAVNEALETFFPDKNVRVIAEPGRYYVASAFTLVTNIESKKIIYDATTNDVSHVMYYINDGVYGSFNCLLYDHQFIKPILLHKPDEENKIESTIWGPTCDALDKLIDIPMPDVDIGEFIIFENMGAYTIPVASPFNGFPLPKVYCFIKREDWQNMRSLISIDADDLIKDFLNKTVEHAVCESFYQHSRFFNSTIT